MKPHSRRETSTADVRMTGLLLAMSRVREDARRKGLMRGKGGLSSIACPICGQTISYSVEGLRGMTGGECQARDCVKWQED